MMVSTNSLGRENGCCVGWFVTIISGSVGCTTLVSSVGVGSCCCGISARDGTTVVSRGCVSVLTSGSDGGGVAVCCGDGGGGGVRFLSTNAIWLRSSDVLGVAVGTGCSVDVVSVGVVSELSVDTVDDDDDCCGCGVVAVTRCTGLVCSSVSTGSVGCGGDDGGDEDVDGRVGVVCVLLRADGLVEILVAFGCSSTVCVLMLLESNISRSLFSRFDTPSLTSGVLIVGIFCTGAFRADGDVDDVAACDCAWRGTD